MNYNERLRRYEAEKRDIARTAATSTEYEKRLKELARKWRI